MEFVKSGYKTPKTGRILKKLFLPAELKRRTKQLQFDVHCKAIGGNFDCGCGFLQDTYNGAVFRFRSKKGYAIFLCYEYHLDLLMLHVVM